MALVFNIMTSKVFFFSFLLIYVASARIFDDRKIFDVTTYGAVAGSQVENSRQFLRAWNDACQWEGKSRVLVPEGEYVLDLVVFVGPCKGPVEFRLSGTLKPFRSPVSAETWITFRYVDFLSVEGGGSFNGLGPNAWPLKSRMPHGGLLPFNIRFEFISNGVIKRIKSIDSQGGHIALYACKNMELSELVISAPGNSPNTDGIKIAQSNNTKVLDSRIGTGDDCIAIISGTNNLFVSNVECGPGHGISVGSMGKYAGIHDVVTGVTVQNCRFFKTTDGLRIKTWATSISGLAYNITYKNIDMKDVGNPINIDQEYCPKPPCQSIPSRIQIKGVTYNNIKGTTSRRVAVSFKCSKSNPCQDIEVRDVNLVTSSGGGAIGECHNVEGKAFGKQNPPSCL